MNQTAFNFPPASRNTDPVTSHLAEQNLKEARYTQAGHVLGLVMVHPGLTAYELANKSNGRLDRYQTQRRLSDLENDNHIEKGPKRICTVSGRLAVTWRVT